jgi:hypothetical protein
MDSGDKAAPKAMSVAYRIALLQALNLPTDDADPDSQSYERSPRQQQSAGDAWEGAQPSRPAQGAQRNGNGNGTVQRPAQPSQRPAQPAADDDLLGAWGAKVDEITSQEDADRADAELKEVFKAKKIDATQANAIRRAIRDKAEAVKAAAS